MPKITTITCTNCNASLSVLGGHHVHSHTCASCGAILNTQNNYAVTAKHPEILAIRPSLPLKIGLHGTLRKVAFTIIGAVEYRQRLRNDEARWLSYQLFSPTHGYAWLTWAYDHPKRYQFSRRVRSWSPNYERVKDRYVAEMTFIAGELTWLANIGDKVKQGQTYEPNISFETRQGETAYFFNQYFTAKTVHQAFGATPLSDEILEKAVSVAPKKSKERLELGYLPVIILLILIMFAISLYDDNDEDESFEPSIRASRPGDFANFGK